MRIPEHLLSKLLGACITTCDKKLISLLPLLLLPLPFRISHSRSITHSAISPCMTAGADPAKHDSIAHTVPSFLALVLLCGRYIQFILDLSSMNTAVLAIWCCPTVLRWSTGYLFCCYKAILRCHLQCLWHLMPTASCFNSSKISQAKCFCLCCRRFSRTIWGAEYPTKVIVVSSISDVVVQAYVPSNSDL